MKVLIVEDDQLIREGLRDILATEGHDCFLATDGVHGWHLYQQSEPQLILLDVMMPNEDGYSLCRKIRAVDADVAIIFVSAKSEEIDQVLGLELGADDYILKPFGKHEVIARVRAVTRRYLKSLKVQSQDNSLDNFDFGDWQVSPSELRARKQDKTIELSLRDCRILEFLAKSNGQVVHRDALFNHAWGRDYLPNSRTLDQHIAKLRKLIEPVASEPQFIITVHGVGYRYCGLD